MTAAAPPEVAKRFRSDIHGLRAVAVALVVLYHAGLPWLPGGYVGVDVFFVISGTLITGLLLTELDRTGRVSLRHFWARRIRRLLPASVLVLLVTLVAARIMLPPLKMPDLGSAAIATAAYLANVWFGWTGTDYLADPAPSPLLHYWSLAVEEQFYLFWPVMLLLAGLWWRERRGVAAAVVTAVVGVASFALCVVLTPMSQPIAFFGLPTRAWEFAVGGAVALALRHGVRVPVRAAAAMGWLGLLVILAAGVLYDDGTPFPGWTAAVPVLGAALVIAAGPSAAGRGPERVLRWAPFQKLGDWSYSLYLWHWPLLVLPAAALGAPLAGWERAALMLLGVLLAAVTFRHVEERFRHLPGLVVAPRRSYGFGLVATGVAVAVAAGAATVPRLDAGRPAVAVDQMTAHTVPEFVPSNLEPSLLEAAEDIPRIYGEGCHAGFADVRPSDCRYGHRGGERTMVLFGDSHAAQWFPALRRVAEAAHWELRTYTKSSCPSASIPVEQVNLERSYWECGEWRENVFRELEEVQPDLVVLANHRAQRLDSGEPAGSQDWVDGLATTFDALPEDSAVMVLADTPQFSQSPPVCLSGALEHPAECAEPRAEVAPDSHAAMERTAAEVAGATFVDTREWVCPGDTCQVMLGNALMYRDRHHLTRHFAASLAPELRELLAGQGLLPDDEGGTSEAATAPEALTGASSGAR